MRGSFRWKLVCFLLLFLLPASLHGQAVRQRPPYQPGPPAAAQTADPRLQRAAREKAVAIVGTKGRDFVESYGQDAVAAIFACSRPAAVRLVEFHASGGLAKLPRPRELLRAIGKPNHGTE